MILQADLSPLINAAVLLNPDNFTDLKRTPWAGADIGPRYKRGLVAGASERRIGESWEFSADPAFPSSLAAYPQVTLNDLVERFPDAILSPSWRQYQQRPHCEILLKLLNANSPLSLQVHPQDADPDLKADECGKPESWLVLHAERGAGLYLGFAKPLTKAELAHALATAADLRPYLNFVPVEANDFFDIAPGVPHAIGPGVTLLEPQRISAGKSGKTYRLWDWNRRYNAAGELAADGTPRPLHVEASLRLIDPSQQVGEAFVATLRRQATLSHPRPGCELRSYPPNAYYQVSQLHLAKNTQLTCRLTDGYGALLVLAGTLRLASTSGMPQELPTGQPALLPFAAAPYTLSAAEDCQLVVVSPSQARLFWI